MSSLKIDYSMADHYCTWIDKCINEYEKNVSVDLDIRTYYIVLDYFKKIKSDSLNDSYIFYADYILGILADKKVFNIRRYKLKKLKFINV